MNKLENSVLVSVIMPVYNRTEFIAEALDSLCRQEYKNIEVIIVDDGSQMDIESCIKDFYSKLKIFFYKKDHIGVSDSRNHGIARAHGEYLAFLDDDDLFHPQMIKTALGMAEKTGAEMIAVGYKLFWNANIDITQEYEDFKICHNINFQTLSFNSIFPVNTVFVKKEIVDKVGRFDPHLNAVEDWDLWLRIMATGIQPRIVKRCLCFIRIHKNNTSCKDAFMQEGRLKVLQKAENYLDPKIQKEIGLKNKITLRHVFTGWYHIAYGSKQKGRRYLFEAVRRNIFFLPFVLILFIISILPQRFLAWLTLKIEILLNRRNFRREETLRQRKNPKT